MIDVRSLDYGPVYNPLNQNGLPVLGAWNKAGVPKRADALSVEPEQFSSFIPAEGPIILRSVWLDERNEIRYNVATKSGFSALLFDEEFGIAEHLIFAGPEPIFPHFYFNEHGKKVFDPEWLSEKDMGRTLYACHHFINTLVFKTDDFDIASKEMFFNPSWCEHVHDMIGDFPAIVQKSNISADTHVAIVKPLQFKGNVEGEIDNGWAIKDIDLDISFVVVDKKTGAPVEYISAFLHANRGAFPQLIPNFERLRQLWSLLYALHALKKAGFEIK